MKLFLLLLTVGLCAGDAFAGQPAQRAATTPHSQVSTNRITGSNVRLGTEMPVGCHVVERPNSDTADMNATHSKETTRIA